MRLRSTAEVQAKTNRKKGGKMLSALRGNSPPRTISASQNPVIYEDGRSRVEFHPPTTRSKHFMMTNVMRRQMPARGPRFSSRHSISTSTKQRRFRVVSGTAVFYKGLSPLPRDTIRTGDGRLAHIEARRYHRFENRLATEDLVVEIQLDPEDYDNEVRFFRNFFGYLDDCRRAGTAPSLFQLMVFLKSADTPLALPLPLGPVSETVGVWVSWLFMHVVAFVGSLLGYKDSYPEYYETGKSR